MKAPPRPPKDPIEAGTHRAICYCVCDLGTQDVTYPGKPPSIARQLKIQWELPDIRTTFEEDGNKVSKPKLIGNTYTFSLYEGANLFKHLTSWAGSVNEDFEFESLLGQNCMLSVVHKKSKVSGNIYARVAGVMQMPAGMPTSEPENPTVYYSIEEHGRNLPEPLAKENMKWLAELIMKAKEFQNGIPEPDPSIVENPDYCGEDGTGEPPPEDDIPF